MKKKFKSLFEFVKKEETESGAIGLREHGLFGDLGKGINIFFTDEIEKSATPQTIFKPINL